MNYMLYGYENIFSILLYVVGFIVIIWAQVNVSSTYNRYKQKNNKRNLSGQEVAREILDKNGLNDIYIVEVKGSLTDHYDPSRKVVRLSQDIYNGTSIASVAVAAHECGHVIQDKDGYKFMKIRTALVPIVNFITYIGYIVAVISLLGGLTGYLKISFLIILAALLFQLVTLPVEFDASKRANEELKKYSLVDNEELDDIKKVLSAAALTYVASFVSSLLNLLRIVIMLGNRDNR